MNRFKLKAGFRPEGDQPRAIEELCRNIEKGVDEQVLLGVTGSGKTFTVANCLERLQRPSLVFAHNKTLASQLYAEFKEFFPENAVEYFVSYYDYYQPEAYIPSSDTYIEKDSNRNDEIERMRLSATRSLLERRDVIVVASVSCIYGLGSPDDYKRMTVMLEEGAEVSRSEILNNLINIQYERNDLDFFRGGIRVRGDVVEVFPSYEDSYYRIQLFGDEIEEITAIGYPGGEKLRKLERLVIYPARHFVVPQERIDRAVHTIREELRERLEEFRSLNKLLEAQRLNQKTLLDIEMLKETGTCNGIENYSRHLSGRKPGEPPYTLLDFLPRDTLMFIDESHQTIPQIRGMFNGDRSRKTTLVEYGFRLPSALDNRPLTFDEFDERTRKLVYVSATPGPYELQRSGNKVVEQIIRPTGLVDPEVEVVPAENQVAHLSGEIKKRLEKNERVLVTALTKRMAEDLCSYYDQEGLPVRYLHSEIKTLERVEILRDLRLGVFSVLIGVNLLREGLDLPEVSLVAILDADKEGFLRSAGSLIQTSGRAARHLSGKVIMYADKVTGSMAKALGEMNRRREKQLAHNKLHNITPRSIRKNIAGPLGQLCDQDYLNPELLEKENRLALIAELEKDMRLLAGKLDFEKAAQVRDRIIVLRGK
ncbi:MAG: excinuclease ABC subunit UvrB [bacterium]